MQGACYVLMDPGLCNYQCSATGSLVPVYLYWDQGGGLPFYPCLGLVESYDNPTTRYKLDTMLM